MRPVFAKLTDMGIYPSHNSQDAPRPDMSAEDLLARVRRRAAELRAEWKPPRVEGVPDPELPEDTE